MDNSNETSICPDCGAIRYDYCGMQVCSDCYHKAIEEMEKERYGSFTMVTGDVVPTTPENIARDWKLRGL